MAHPEINDIIQRGRDLLAAYPSAAVEPTLGTDVSEGALVYALPAYEVVEGAATRVMSSRRYIVTRTLRVLVYVVELGDVTHEPSNRTALAAARAWIDPIADYLGLRAGWNLGTVASALLTDVGSPEDAGAGYLDYNKKKYAGFILEIPVTYGR